MTGPGADSRGSAAAPLRKAGRFGGLFGLLLGLALVVGFVGFVHFSSQRHAGPAHADGIVVLTGGDQRIAEGVRLLADGSARRLLITGVYPHTTMEQLSDLSGGERRLFGCCIDIDRRAADTRGNAEEAASWARINGFRRLIVVTSDYHIARTMLEFRRRLPGHELLSWPVDSRSPERPAAGAGLRRWVAEYAKYLLALASLPVGSDTMAEAGRPGLSASR